MQLRINAQGLDLPADARRAIERRVRLAFGRHTAEIERAQVVLSQGPAKTAGNLCRIRVRLRDGERLAVEDRAPDIAQAAAAAAWRLENRLEHRRMARLTGPAERRPRRRA